MAHSLRGSSATMGASGVASACALLEAAGARGEVVGADGLHRLVVELEQAEAALVAQA